MKEGRHYIVVRTTINESDEYEVHERYKDANKLYRKWLGDDYTYTTSMCAVIHSSDHETHPKFQ